jgi:hypothetical protein
MQDGALFLDVCSNQSSLIKRLATEFREAAREFIENPAAYIRSAFKNHASGNARRRDLLRFGMAMGLVVYATLFAAMLMVWTLHARHNAGADKNPELTVVHLSAIQPQESPLSKSDKDEQGGGGNHQTMPASQGDVKGLEALATSSPFSMPRACFVHARYCFFGAHDMVLSRISASPRVSWIAGASVPIQTSVALAICANVWTLAFPCCVHSSIEARTRRPGVKSSKLIPQPFIVTTPEPPSKRPSLQR